jgi:endo-1,4-beta-xylanase
MVIHMQEDFGEARGHAALRISRRRCLGGLGAAAVALPDTGSTGAVPSLAAVARSKGLLYGAAPFDYPPIFTPAYDRLVVEQCAMLAPVLNWSLVYPSPNQFRANSDLNVVTFAEANRLFLTGWHLLWHEATPRWFAQLPDQTAARRAIELYIERMGAAYAGATWSVNVVNEALDPEGGGEQGLRRDAFTAKLGGTYIDLAFRAARRAFPRARLIYNDYGLEQGSRGMLRKRAALLRLIDGLQAGGTPIDGIGLQSHLTLSLPFEESSYAAFLREITARGLCIVITELDVLDVSAPGNIAARDQLVAGMYHRYLDTALANEAVAGLVTWGLSDRYSWLIARTKRHSWQIGGSQLRPLPFDPELRPKPAFFAMVKAVEAAPSRRVR